jgi:hypothetical protein
LPSAIVFPVTGADESDASRHGKSVLRPTLSGMRERELRSRLVLQLGTSFSTPTRAIPEFWIPVSHERADLVLVGRRLEAFEIKSAADDLLRLPRQVGAYGKVFDRCTAVVAERHLPAASAMLPSWWGLMTFPASEATFIAVRASSDNPEVDRSTLVRLLWKEEVRAALAELGYPVGAHEARESMWDLLLGSVDGEQLRGIVRDVLYDRDPAAARFGSPLLRSSLAFHGPASARS